VLLYWVGVAAAVTCLALSFTVNTQFVSQFEYAGIPLPIFAGILSVAAFLGAEYGEAYFETRVAEDPVQALQSEA
jgi:hypothetical protein